MQWTLDDIPTLPQLLEKCANERPDVRYLHEVESGASMTYAQTYERSLRWAAAFKAAGIGHGDRVVTWQYAGNESVCIWAGLGWLGAIDVGINTDYKGALLRYVLQQSRAKIVILLREFVDRLDDIKADLDPDVRFLVIDDDGVIDGFFDGAPAFTGAETYPWDISCIIYTSGTTGPSKGVLIPWAHIHATCEGCFPFEDAGDDERTYAPFSMFHMSGRMPTYMMALCGGGLVSRPRISATQFWNDIESERCTITLGGGAVLDEMLARPESPDDKDFPLRQMVGGPIGHNTIAFGERFNVRMGTAFNMTEISCPITNLGNITDYMSCGRLREGYPGYEVRVVDEHDRDVGPNKIGELIVRTAVPWTLNAGYDAMPDKTAEAWRNGWFHTGDALMYDEHGNFFYKDRFKDALRRRGENISSFEVEMYIVQHDEVLECAVIGVPSKRSGEEIKACVVRTEDSALTAEELVRWAIPRMPRFMVPRYVEFYDELPKTEASLKIRKHLLRDEGVTENTWDREAAGVEVPR